MPIKNPKQLLVDIANVPASFEAGLPNGVPRLSSAMANFAASLPTLPDFPMSIPDIPTLPQFSMPGSGNGGAAKTETPAPAPAKRSLVKFVYE